LEQVTAGRLDEERTVQRVGKLDPVGVGCAGSDRGAHDAHGGSCDRSHIGLRPKPRTAPVEIVPADLVAPDHDPADHDPDDCGQHDHGRVYPGHVDPLPGHVDPDPSHGNIAAKTKPHAEERDQARDYPHQTDFGWHPLPPRKHESDRGGVRGL
jgi:hypothetical protein